MVVAGTQSFVEGREHSTRSQVKPGTQSHSDNEPPCRCRVERQSSGPEESVTDSPREQLPDSSPGSQAEVFLVPDVLEDALWREREVKRVQRALGASSEDDKDWELLATSRCLSQFITILPYLC